MTTTYLEMAMETFFDQFICEQCAIGPDHMVSQAGFYQAFLDWWKIQNLIRPPVKRFFDRIVRKRFQAVDSKGVGLYLGVGLMDWQVEEALNGRR